MEKNKIAEYIQKNRKTLNYGEEYPTFIIKKISPFAFLGESKDIPIPFQTQGGTIQRQARVDTTDVDMVRTVVIKSVVYPKIVEREVDYEKEKDTISFYDIDGELLNKLIQDILDFNGYLTKEDTKEFFRE